MKEIQILEPLFKAWDDMVVRLFKPFNLSRWLIVAFTAWLAYIGEGWGGGFNCNSGFPDFKNLFKQTRPQCKQYRISHSLSLYNQYSPINQYKLRPLFEKIKKILTSTPFLLVFLISITAIIIGVSIALLIMWLKCRGEFMFIDNLVQNRAEIGMPWKEYKNHANSLFVWQLGISISLLILFFIILGIGGLMLYPWISDCLYIRKLLWPSASTIAGIIAFIFLFFIFIIVSALVTFFIKQILIPLMYFRNIFFYDAALLCLNIIRNNLLIMAGYVGVWILLNIIIGTGVFILTLIVGVCTCCIGLFFMSLPYLWAVFFLPLLVFLRCFSINFTEQFVVREKETPQEICP